VLVVIVPMAGLLLLHAPPVTVFVSVDVSPIQTVVAPEIAAGTGSTLSEAVVLQPVESVKVIVTPPGETPVATPVVAPIEARAVLLLLQVPPPALVSVTAAPTHT
jgi:hypothetical protein